MKQIRVTLLSLEVEEFQKRIMCYRVDCKTCGKYSWGGCGQHLQHLYDSIDEGKHCMCRSWPGVVIPSQRTASTTEQSQQSGNSSQGNENPQNS